MAKEENQDQCQDMRGANLITVGSTNIASSQEFEGGARQRIWQRRAITDYDRLASDFGPVDPRPQLVYCNKLDHCGSSLESRVT